MTQTLTPSQAGTVMTATESSALFPIAVLVERYGASAESFRNWERQGQIPPARRTPGGHRRYGPEHLAALDKLFGYRHLPPAAPSGETVAANNLTNAATSSIVVAPSA